MYTMHDDIRKDVLGPERQVYTDPDVVESKDGYIEVYSYGFIPKDLYSIFFDVWTGKYSVQIIIKARDAIEAMQKLRFLYEKGRYKITMDPAVNAIPK